MRGLGVIAAMVATQFAEVGMNTILKAAMGRGHEHYIKIAHEHFVFAEKVKRPHRPRPFCSFRHCLQVHIIIRSQISNSTTITLQYCSSTFFLWVI